MKNLIVILFLLLMLLSACAASVNDKKIEPLGGAENQPVTAEIGQPVSEAEQAVIPKKAAEEPKIEKIKTALIIEGSKHETEIAAQSSVFDLMEKLKMENKISFSGKNYPNLGFFVEEINGVENNPSEENWIYYVNNQPASVGVSNYILKNNDIIEWKYERQSF